MPDVWPEVILPTPGPEQEKRVHLLIREGCLQEYLIYFFYHFHTFFIWNEARQMWREVPWYVEHCLLAGAADGQAEVGSISIKLEGLNKNIIGIWWSTILGVAHGEHWLCSIPVETCFTGYSWHCITTFLSGSLGTGLELHSRVQSGQGVHRFRGN